MPAVPYRIHVLIQVGNDLLRLFTYVVEYVLLATHGELIRA